MPEFPEIARLSLQLNEHVCGKTIAAIDVIQPKSLNIPVDEFQKSLIGAVLLKAIQRGKWVQIETSRGWLLLNLGMGGEVLLVTPETLPHKRRVVFGFTDGACLSVNFWWFGYVHYATPDGLSAHGMTARLGPNALDLSAADLGSMIKTARGNLKSFLLDQSRIAGIGNAYIHDILFLARLHPHRKLEKLSAIEIENLHTAIQQGLHSSLDKGGAWYEVDLFGQPGGFVMDDILIGYREGKPCPNCGTLIEKIRTGSTTSYICPVCQLL